MLEKAKDALKTQNNDERDFMSMTLAIRPGKIAVAKNLIAEEVYLQYSFAQ